MGSLSITYDIRLESEVLHHARLLGGTEFLIRPMHSEFSPTMIMTVSGSSVPDRASSTTLIVKSHTNFCDDGTLAEVVRTVSWGD